MRSKTPKPPKHIWADYDASYPKDSRWTFYRAKADQRANRPDLKPIKFRLIAE